MIAGLLAEHGSWRNFWWLNVGLLGLATVVALLAFPETRWDRSENNNTHTQSVSPESSQELREKGMAGESREMTITREGGHQTSIRNGRPGYKQFLFHHVRPDPIQCLFLEFVAPLKMFAYPIVDFAAFVVSWSASSVLIVNLTQAEAFAAPPYNYTAQTIGFFNFAIVIGQIIGLVTAGSVNDWISMRATKRNNGVREPEMRLPAMIPYTLIMILGNFIIAFGYQNEWDWRVGRDLAE